MKVKTAPAKQALMITSLLAALLVPSVGGATPVVVQTVGAASNAVAGDVGITVPGSAMLSVLVFSPIDGSPVANLGSSVGSQTTTITLPAGWTLRNSIVPPGGCTFEPSEFSNMGSGWYVIRVVQPAGPSPRSELCNWDAGDYHYVIEVNVTVGGATFRGSSLGVLTIPRTAP